jgi:hypothetical protein
MKSWPGICAMRIAGLNAAAPCGLCGSSAGDLTFEALRPRKLIRALHPLELPRGCPFFGVFLACGAPRQEAAPTSTSRETWQSL